MLNRRLRASFLSALPVLALLAGTLRAGEVELANDSLGGGGTAAIQAGFVPGEIGAAVLESPGPATLISLQVQIDRYILLGQPLGPQTMTGRFYVWDNADLAGGVLAPGAAVFISPDLTLTAGNLNILPVLTEGIEVDGAFTVGLQIVTTGTSFGITSPSLVTDTDGCQNPKNWVRQTNGVWANLCGFGVSGDLVIRATVDVADQGQFIDLGNALAGDFSPSLTGSGSLVGGENLTLTFADLPPADAGWLFIGVVELNAPFLGGTLVPDPLVTVIIPTGAGSIVINDVMPGGIPSGVEIFLHMWVADPGGPQGASATNALKLVTP